MTTEKFINRATGDSIYAHIMGDFDLRPLQIRKHLVEVHHIEPNIPRKRYEREVWHGQHERAHTIGISGFTQYVK